MESNRKEKQYRVFRGLGLAIEYKKLNSDFEMLTSNNSEKQVVAFLNKTYAMLKV